MTRGQTLQKMGGGLHLTAPTQKRVLEKLWPVQDLFRKEQKKQNHFRAAMLNWSMYYVQSKKLGSFKWGIRLGFEDGLDVWVYPETLCAWICCVQKFNESIRSMPNIPCYNAASLIMRIRQEERGWAENPRIQGNKTVVHPILGPPLAIYSHAVPL